MGLRDDQLQAWRKINQAWADGCRAPVLVRSTGWGKTFFAAEFMDSWVRAGHRVWFLAHLDSILLATGRRLEANGQRFGWIWGQRPQDPDCGLQVCSVASAVRRIDRVLRPDLIVVDECDLAVAPTYQRLFTALGQPFRLGLTGTPIRSDGRGLGAGGFDRLILGPETADLVDQGVLAPLRIWSWPSPVIFQRLENDHRDPQAAEGASVFSGPVLLGDALEHWTELAIDERGCRPTVAFCHSVPAAEETARRWREAGYRAVAVDASTPPEARRAAERGLAEGELDLVACADLWLAGVDVPEIACILCLRWTQSVRVWLQMIGRGLRKGSGRWSDLLLLDVAGNCRRPGIGDPLARRNHLWTLEGDGGAQRMRENIPPVFVCPECYSTWKVGNKCMECGYDYSTLRIPQGLRVVDGKLTMFRPSKEQIVEEKKAQELRRRREEAACWADENPLRSFLELGRRRGYDNPAGWAYKRVRASRHGSG